MTTHLDNTFGKSSIERTAENISIWVESIDPVLAISLLAFVVLVYVFRKPLANCVLQLLSFLMRRLESAISEEIRGKLREAVQVLLVTFAMFIVLEIIQPPELLSRFLRRVLTSICIIAVFSGWYRLAAVFVSMLSSEEHAKSIRLEQDWTVRVTQFSVVLFGLAALLEVWEIDISGALTGVGVLGAGLAIASQDLVRNLLAGMTNSSEERFVSGDTIDVEGLVAGVVERVDLRSTLVVGFDQIPRFVPNAELANSVVLNYSRMKHRRIMMTFGLVLSASESQVIAVRDGLQRYMHESGDFDTSDDAPCYVRVTGLSDHSIDILFYGRSRSPTYSDFLRVSENLSLKILSLVAEVGTQLAHPTQTIKTVSPAPHQTPGPDKEDLND